MWRAGNGSFVTPAGSAAGVIYTAIHRKRAYVHERSMSMSSLHLDVCGVSMAVHGHGRLRPLSRKHTLLSTSPADASKQASIIATAAPPPKLFS